MKIEWAVYQNEDDTSETKNVFYENLDRDLYNSQYQGKLFCIGEECNAMIKFTHRKNGKKFYSTWNGQGDLHNTDCPYHLQYKGKKARKKLIEQNKSTSISDEHIEGTILRKSENLKSTEKVKVPKQNLKTREVVDNGLSNITQMTDDGTVTADGSRQVKIFSIDSNYVTPDYVGHRKCIFGKIKNAYLSEEENYAYINLDNKQYTVNIRLTEAFYSDSSKTTKEALRNFINVINREKDNKELIIICVGIIEFQKKRKGINIQVINPRHLAINDSTYDKINSENKIKDNPYNY